MDYYTYLYTDPARNEPIYVGKGKDDRAYWHLKRKDRCHFTNRLRKMKREGIEPVITFLASNVSEDEALSLEIWFIHKFGRKDLKNGPLLNLTDGGDGASGAIVSDETRKKLSDISSNPSDETRKRLSEGSIAFHQDPVKRANYLAGREKTFTPEWTENNRKAQLKRYKDPAARKKLSDAQKIAQNDPTIKAKNIAMITEVHNRPEVKASKSAKMKAYWAARRAAK